MTAQSFVNCGALPTAGGTLRGRLFRVISVAWVHDAKSGTGGWSDAKKGSHGPRRMGDHGSPGDGAGRAGAAASKTPAAHAYGRDQEASGGRFRPRSRQPASGAGQMQVVSRA